MTIYLYTKMSNFCTALCESYQYYNQCRTASRRLAREKQGIIDEHMILIQITLCTRILPGKIFFILS